MSRTYKGFDGLAPINAYIGAEGYLINTELREGKQHSQKHTPEFLTGTVSLCKKLTQILLLVRMDSGNDASDNLGILLDTGCYFIIKRNLRQESREEWLERLRGGLQKCYLSKGWEIRINRNYLEGCILGGWDGTGLFAKYPHCI